MDNPILDSETYSITSSIICNQLMITNLMTAVDEL